MHQHAINNCRRTSSNSTSERLQKLGRRSEDKNATAVYTKVRKLAIRAIQRRMQTAQRSKHKHSKPVALGKYKSIQNSKYKQNEANHQWPDNYRQPVVGENKLKAYSSMYTYCLWKAMALFSGSEPGLSSYRQSLMIDGKVVKRHRHRSAKQPEELTSPGGRQ